MKIDFEKLSTWMNRLYVCVLVVGAIGCYIRTDKVGIVLCCFSLGMWMSDWLHEKLDKWEGE